MISTRNLTYAVPGQTLLKDVSCDLGEGEFTAILGPNGAGKSTLLKALTGSLANLSDKVVLDGKPLRNWPRLALARHRAVVGQFHQIAFPFSVADVVELGREPYRRHESGGSRWRSVEQALEAMDCTHLWDRLFSTLSGGEQQRVTIARALAQLDFANDRDQPRYLFLDEPTASLDLKHQHALLTLLLALNNRGFSVVIVLHDLNLAHRYARRAILMQAGRLVVDAEINAALTSRNIQSVFDVAVDRLESTDGTPTLAFSLAASQRSAIEDAATHSCSPA